MQKERSFKLSYSILAYRKGKTMGQLHYNTFERASIVYKIFNAEKYNTGISGNGTEVIYTSNFIKNALVKAQESKDEKLIEFLKKIASTNDMITIVWR